jgi:hypothetical protein
MRKLTLLAIGAILMLAQSSPALSSTFSGPYACRASAPYSFSTSAPVMFFTANAGGFFIGGNLVFLVGSNLCGYSIFLGDSTFTPAGLSGYGNLDWAPLSGGCPPEFTFHFGYVLSGLPSSNASANTVQITDQLGPSWECTQK